MIQSYFYAYLMKSGDRAPLILIEQSLVKFNIVHAIHHIIIIPHYSQLMNIILYFSVSGYVTMLL